MKKKLIIGLIFIIVIIYGVIFYNDYLSNEAVVGRKNAENIKKIKIGMDTTQVLKIMGEPEEKYTYQGTKFFNYAHPLASSETIQIKFDSSGKVIYK